MVSFLHAIPISPVDTGDDDRRIAALVALDLLDSAPEREFDAIVALAVSVLQTPFAAITLVGRDRLWMKAHAGVSSVEEPREFSFCHYTIQSEDVLVVSDVEQDPRFDARGIALWRAHRAVLCGNADPRAVGREDRRTVCRRRDTPVA